MEKTKITQEDLLNFLQEKFGKEATMESHLTNDLGMDSLDTAELVMKLEDMGFEVPDDKGLHLKPNLIIEETRSPHFFIEIFEENSLFN